MTIRDDRLASWSPLVAWAAVGCLLATGCTQAPQPQFDLNLVYAKSQEFKTNAELDDTQLRNVQEILVGMFGTPDDPAFPEIEGVDVSGLFTPVQLSMAAGAVGTDEAGRPRGLYRRHCAHCHGVSGDGGGPTASVLNPYPRDYRRGTFKFKSTSADEPPSKEDLHRILVEGVAGTAMPSFRYLPNDELEALAGYVRYLSIRGKLERQLYEELANEVDPGEKLVDLALMESDTARFAEQMEVVNGLLEENVTRWIESESAVVEVPARPEGWDLAESIAKGKELFYSGAAGCTKCHGEAALGDGQLGNYDVWGQELEPTREDHLDEYLALGALPPRTIRPRNLRQGIYRGGRRPIDLFWRIHNGISGSGMPNAKLRAEDAPATDGLTTDDIWHIIDYVRSLPYESISQPKVPEPVNARARM